MLPLKSKIGALFTEMFNNSNFDAEKDIQPYFEIEFNIEVSKQINTFIVN